jgi:fatty acid desaturase
MPPPVQAAPAVALSVPRISAYNVWGGAMQLAFKPRQQLADFEWELTQSFKNRVDLDRETIRTLSERSNLHGLLRVALFSAALVLLAWGSITAASLHGALAILPLYGYWFLYGFLVALGHELQHKMVFRSTWEPFSEIIYFLVQVCMWNSPRYARISHRLHHRFTMVRGIDPETDWPAVITSAWLRRYLRGTLSSIFVVGVPRKLAGDIRIQIARIIGKKDRMMRDHCSEKDCRRIRMESAAILAIHVGVVAASLWFWTPWPVLLVTVAWQIGSAMESLWHSTEHIGRIYDVNDQRLATRSVRVSPLIRLLYGGLDDHVDHHLFPSVPSMNLPKLHQALSRDLAPPLSMIGCWREMFAIAREKDVRADSEFVPVPVISSTVAI